MRRQHTAITLAVLGLCATLVTVSAAPVHEGAEQSMMFTAFVYSLDGVVPGTVIPSAPRGNE